MDGYPGTYVSHNLPLIILSGLGSGSGHASGTGSYPLLHENGFRITSDIPPVTGSNAEQLLRIFLDADASKGRWNRRHENEPVSNIGFQVKEVGRVGQDVHIFDQQLLHQRDVDTLSEE